MLRNIRSWLFKPIKFRFLLPLIYLFLILLAQLTFLIPNLNKCRGFLVLEGPLSCFRISESLADILGLPGYYMINLVGFLFPMQYKFWVSLSDLNQGFFLITIYELTIFLIYIFGLIIDKITAAFSTKKRLNRVYTDCNFK